MKILVTGAKGMLGRDVTATLKEAGHIVIETDINNLDITNFNQSEYVIRYYRPDVVVHCAAYTNVDKAEEDIEKATLINEKGTENLAKITAERDIPIVYISTDYVFDGEGCRPYKPHDCKNPISVYGKTKSAGEDAIEKFCKKYYILRTSWLYGHNGKNFVETIINLLQTKPEIKVVDDQTGCPTWTMELARIIKKTIDNELDYGIYHICGSGQTTWYGFACKIAEFMNLNTPIYPCTTEEFPRPAKRPSYSVMDNLGLCSNWEDALKEYIEKR